MNNVNQKEIGYTSLNDGKTSQETTNTERFVISYTIDYGYRLHPEDDLDKEIIPKFEDENISYKFSNFFSPKNTQLILGKRPYCDCTGKHYKRDGQDFYKIRKAHLFAK